MKDEFADHEIKSISSKQRFLSETTTNIQPSQSIYLKAIESTTSTYVLAEPSISSSSTSSELTWPKGNSSDEIIKNSKLSSATVAKISQNKQHLMDNVVNSENWPTSKNFQLNMQNSLQKKKRMRTSFKHQQLRIMKAYFQLNQNPDSKELKELSERTSLSKRTLQVWFQNSRAKQRKTSNSHVILKSHEKTSKQSAKHSDKGETICYDYDYDYDQEDNQDNNDDECSDGDDDGTVAAGGGDDDDDNDNDNFLINKGNDSLIFNANQYFY